MQYTLLFTNRELKKTKQTQIQPTTMVWEIRPVPLPLSPSDIYPVVILHDYITISC